MTSAGAVHAMESRGSRKPAGEVPGVSVSRGRRVRHVVVPQPSPSGSAKSGRTNALGPPAVRASSGRGSAGSSLLAGRRPGGATELVPRGGEGVVVGRQHGIRTEAEAPGHRLGEPSRGIGRGDAPRLDVRLTPRVGEQRGVLPERLAVGPPGELDLPSRERLAGVPLALAVVHDPAGRPPLLEPGRELAGARALLGPVGGGLPLGRGGVADGDEGRLATHRQTDVAVGEEPVDVLAERARRTPTGSSE